MHCGGLGGPAAPAPTEGPGLVLPSQIPAHTQECFTHGQSVAVGDVSVPHPPQGTLQMWQGAPAVTGPCIQNPLPRGLSSIFGCPWWQDLALGCAGTGLHSSSLPLAGSPGTATSARATPANASATCHLSRGGCQAGLTPGVCIGMAQAKQAQWDRVAFRDSGPLKTPWFLSPPQSPACPQTGPAWGWVSHSCGEWDTSCPKPQLSSGEIKQKCPKQPLCPPRPVGWSPPHPFLGPHPGALSSPQGSSPLPCSPHGKPGACPRSA